MPALTSPPPRPPTALLVGTDYSPQSVHAAKEAFKLARLFNARVHLLHAWVAPYAAPSLPVEEVPSPEHPNLLVLVRREAEAQMAEFLAALDPAEVSVTTSVESGDPRAVLLEYAQTHACDWVILGKRRLSAVEEWFLGDVAAYVVRHCQVPVLVVPSAEAP
jgi:nucleotide-binding universal stress UspA family protein